MTRLRGPWVIGLAFCLAAALVVSDAVEVSDLESLRLNMADGNVSSIELLQSLNVSGPLPRITREITIIGNCSDGARASMCLLQLTSSGGAFVGGAGARLTLVNLAVRNGTRKENAALPDGGLDSGRGAAVYMTGGGSLTVTNCEFLNHVSEVEGGAIYLNNITTIITGSNFTGCSAPSGGGQRGVGGAISASLGTLTIVRSNFIQNSLCSSCAGGGALGMSNVRVAISDSYFYGNRGGNQGADGFFQGGSLTVDRSEFAFGSCQRGAAIAAFDTPMVVRDSYFHHGNASLQGGELNLYANQSTLTIERSRFEYGYAGSSSGFMESLGYTVDIRDSSILHMFALSAAGSVQFGRGSILLDNVTVYNSTSTNSAGFISLRDSSPSFRMRRSRVSLCSVRTIFGGVMWNVGGSVYVEDTEFSDNFAFIGGGVLYGEPDATSGSMVYEFNRVVVRNCSVYNDGGMIAATRAGRFTMTDSTIRDVYAGRAGGVFYGGQDSTCTLRNVTVERSRAAQGGVVYMHVRSNLYIEGGLFTNTTASQGGAIYINRFSNTTLNNITLTKTASTFEGGAIFFEGTQLHMNGGLVKDATASRDGGGLLVEETSSARLDKVTFEDIKSDGKGGVIMNQGQLTVTNSTFQRGSAYSGGGAIFNTGKLLDLQQCRFENCISIDAAGGAVSTREASCGDGSSKIVNCTFVGNEAIQGQAGALFVDEPEGLASTCPTPPPNTLLLLGCTFTGNKALAGGAVFIVSTVCEDANVTRCVNIRNSTFVGNIATTYAGGAIWSYGRLPVVCLGGESVNSSRAACRDWEGKNEVTNSSYGPEQATPARSLHVPYGNVDGHASGSPLPDLVVEVVDAYTQPVVGVLASTYRIVVTSMITAGKFEMRAIKGQATFSGVTVFAKPGTYPVTFSTLDDPSVADAVINVTVRACIVGELDPPSGICVECDGTELLSWDTRRPKCDRCPPGAYCGGKANAVPLPGYWHSGPHVYQFHECFNEYSCRYDGRHEKLLADLQKYHKGESDWVSDLQCSPGHHGRLCAVCDDGYGPDPKGTQICKKCEREGILALLVIVVIIIHTLLIAFTVKTATSTFNSDSPAFVDLTKIFITYMQVRAPRRFDTVIRITYMQVCYKLAFLSNVLVQSSDPRHLPAGSCFTKNSFAK
eukprot:jgi/Mesvir1/22528/Mv18548-RA.3